MKKTTVEALYNYFVNGNDAIDLSTVVEDIRTEYERTAGKTAEKLAAYENAKPIVFGVMGDDPLTVKQIYELAKDKLPEDFSANKIQYAFLHYWSDEVVKHDNGKSAKTYSLA